MRTHPSFLLRFKKAARGASRSRWTALAAAVVVGVACGLVTINRTQRAVTVALAQKQSVQVSGPLKIDFNQDVAVGYTATIIPHVAGTWKLERSVFGVSSAHFEPSKRFEAGRTYHLRITGMKRAITGAALPALDQTFTAQVPPSIKSFSPKMGDTTVPVKPKFSVTLLEANQGVRELQPSLTPAVPLKLVASDDKVFTWEPAAPLKQGQAYIFALDDARMPTPEKRRLVTVSFTTVSQPAITSARTGSLFGLGQSIEIVFDQPMEPKAEAFEFDFKGHGGWTNDHTYSFKPEGLLPGKAYGYRIKAGLGSKVGGVLEATRPYKFTTNGAVSAVFSPAGAVSVNSPMRIGFDQAVDHASAEAKFSASPTLAGALTWVGNTMVFTPTGGAYQTAYTFSLAPGVIPVWGLPSNRVLSGSYTTQTQTIKLAVPVYKQSYGRSCELASLRMLLAFRGVMVSDWDILMKIGYNPRPRDTATNSWENPNETFVGNVDTQSWAQGYGVHAGPIAAAARSYGRTATSYANVSAGFIAENIHAGNPVEFWGHISPAKPDSWNTSSGVVQTTTSMHARVVYGVVGRSDAPIGFHIHDPWTGKSFYWSTAELMANMNQAPPASNQAVVVF